MFPFLFYGAQFRTSICSEEECLQLLLPRPAPRLSEVAAQHHVTGSACQQQHPAPHQLRTGTETPRASIFPASKASVCTLRVLGTQVPAERQGREQTPSPAKARDATEPNREHERNEPSATLAGFTVPLLYLHGLCRSKLKKRQVSLLVPQQSAGHWERGHAALPDRGAATAEGTAASTRLPRALRDRQSLPVPSTPGLKL